MLAKLLIIAFAIIFCYICTGCAAASAASLKLSDDEQAKLDQTLQRIENASDDQMENELKTLAAGGSDALKQAVNGIITAQNGRYEFFKKVADEASAHLSPKAYQKLQNVKHLVMDRKLSQEEFDKKLAAIESNPDVEEELKSAHLMDERILDLQNFGNAFLELDKEFISLEYSADTNGDGKLSPYKFSGILVF
ncbi:hypothetical protein GPALN_010599 [Globodera pallida]|nr:hypothetical protein GPALN_010599 [Globodera pallida]